MKNNYPNVDQIKLIKRLQKENRELLHLLGEVTDKYMDEIYKPNLEATGKRNCTPYCIMRARELVKRGKIGVVEHPGKIKVVKDE
jgi:hypothetical protein